MRKKRIFGILALVVLVVVLSELMASPALGQQPPRVKVLIGFTHRPGPAEQALVRRAGGSVEYVYHLVPAIAATVPETAVEHLKANPNVIRVEPDILGHAVDIELSNSWGVEKIGAGTVHDGGNKGTDVKIAIIDSGVDYNHPDLDGNYAGGDDFIEPDGDSMDVYGHGTHVAGTACAEDNGNGVDDDTGKFGVVGVAPECALYSLRVLDDDGWGYASQTIAAMEWAVEKGMQVANLSLGWDRDPGATFQSAFDNAWAAGLIIVAAAGNNGNPPGRGDNVIYPARYDSVIAVAATDGADRRATFSSTGDLVELAAPGVSVYSTWNDGTGYYDPAPVCRDEANELDCYKYGSGTSMASPHVAGTAALIIASGIVDANGNGHTNDEVRQQLMETADDLGATGRDPLYGYGLVDADEAAPGPPEPAVRVALSTDKPEYVSGVDTVAVLAAVVTDETGSAISGLQPEAFDTAVDGTAAYSTFSETATPGTYTADLDISALAEGAYSVAVTVTGPESVVGSDTANISIVSEPTIKKILAESTEFRVEAKGRSGKVRLLLSVHVVEGDIGGPPVAGATVSVLITLPDGNHRTLSGETDTNGDMTLEVDGDAQSGTWRATVVKIEKPGYQFDSAAGVTEDEISL
jgi:subtilisin